MRIEEILKKINKLPKIDKALHWLRWASQANTFPEAFIFYWLALEALAGKETVFKKCGKCSQDFICPLHGKDSYEGIPRKTVENILSLGKISKVDIKDFGKIRHQLLHGDSKITSNTLKKIIDALPKLKNAIEQKLNSELQMDIFRFEKPSTPEPVTSIQSFITYSTSDTSADFPKDMITEKEFNDEENPRNIKFEGALPPDNW